MSQPAKVQEPSMEEILASIRRIITDDDASRTQPKEAQPAPAPTPTLHAVPSPSAAPVKPAAPAPVHMPAPEPDAMSQADIDAVLSGLNEQKAQVTAAQPAPAPAANPDVFELTESMATSEQPEPAFRTIDGESDVMFSDLAPPPAAAPDETPLPPAQNKDAMLLSHATSAVVDAAFDSLARTVLVQNTRTLEDLVKDVLRPMLKNWLDDNLPNLVERLVRAEIERVSRGRP